jgi:Flp pilus assembly protein TadB
LQGQFEDTRKRLESEHAAAMQKAAAKAAQDLAEKDAEMREALATAERDATEALSKAQQDEEARISAAVHDLRTKLEQAQVTCLVCAMFVSSLCFRPKLMASSPVVVEHAVMIRV